MVQIVMKMLVKMKHTSLKSYRRFEIIFKNHLFIIYMGAKVSVCGITQAQSWGILNKINISSHNNTSTQFNSHKRYRNSSFLQR